MGEFDLDLQVGGKTFGWESIYRPDPQDPSSGIRMASHPVLGCATGATCDPTCSFSCDGATGSPCAC